VQRGGPTRIAQGTPYRAEEKVSIKVWLDPVGGKVRGQRLAMHSDDRNEQQRQEHRMPGTLKLSFLLGHIIVNGQKNVHCSLKPRSVGVSALVPPLPIPLCLSTYELMGGYLVIMPASLGDRVRTAGKPSSPISLTATSAVLPQHCCTPMHAFLHRYCLSTDIVW
jgi:hypothetical protein